MAKFFGLVAAVVATAGFSTAATVEDSCAIVDYQAATEDFAALNDLVTVIKASQSLLDQFIADPFTLADKTLGAQGFSLLGMDFTVTPTIKSLSVEGITTISPKEIVVSSSNTIDVGTDFTGDLSVDVTFSVEIAQLNHKWYQVCWTDILHPSDCASTTLTVSATLALVKPGFLSSLTANMYECAEGVAADVCSDLTLAGILSSILGGDLTGVADSVLAHMKDAQFNSLTVSWESISNIEFTFGESSDFVDEITNSLLDFSADTLNEKGDIYDSFVYVLQGLLLSMFNVVVDTQLETRFGATCL